MTSTQHPNICLPIWNLKSSHTRTKPSPASQNDTCTDVNIMPVSIYRYLFKDPDCTKIAPSDWQLGTYTNKRVKQLIYHMSRYKMFQRNNIFLWPAMKAVS